MASIGVWVLLAALVLAGALTVVVVARAVGRGRDDESGGGGDEQGRGGGGDGGDRPNGPAGGSDWAAFERDFWAYVDHGRPSSGARRRH